MLKMRCCRTKTWNDRLGAEKRARNHDAQEGVPFLQREFSYRSHVLQTAIVHKNCGRGAEFADGFSESCGDFCFAGNIAMDIRDRRVGRRLYVPAHRGIAETL
jgi:hypothetical protein